MAGQCIHAYCTSESLNSGRDGDQWNAAQGANCLGPFDAYLPNTEDICTQFMMAVPPAYLEFVL